MNRTTRLTLLTTLTSAVLAATITGIASTGASAIDKVNCDSRDYLEVTYHGTTPGPPDPYYDSHDCLANGGEWSWPQTADSWTWATHIWTGNNRVQWYGDGKWQPDQPIEKWTDYTWPHHPGGVHIEKIRIV